MDGPLVDPWKEDQLRKLEARITAGTADTDEAHWTTFKQDFFFELNLFNVVQKRVYNDGHAMYSTYNHVS